MTDIFKVPRVSATQASLDNFNNPLTYIQNALNEVADTQAKLYNKSAIILFDQPVVSSARAGDLVYYDVDQAAFAPAIAQLNAELGRQGQTVQSPRSRVVGMLLSYPAAHSNGYVATMLCGGMYQDGTIAQQCLGQTPMPGTYYLSPWTAGKAVLDPKQNLRQPVLQYMGDGKFTLNCFYLAHDGHQHASVALTYTYWSQDMYQNKYYVYDPEGKDQLYVALGQLSPSTTALFVDGKLQAWDQGFVIDPELGLCATQLPSPDTKLVLMNHYPLAYGAPVVRDVVSKSAHLETQKKGGVVQVSAVPYVYKEDTGTGLAVYDVTDAEIVRHPVINKIVAGIGINAYTKSGTVTITNTALDSIYADATMINLNGAVHIEQGGLTFIVFPAGRQTAVNMYYPVNYVQDTAKATVWLQYSTQTAAQASISLSYIQLPDNTDIQVEIPQPWQLQALQLTSVNPGKLKLAQTEPIRISKPGYLCASIKTAPTSNIKLLRQGFRVTTEV